MASGRLLDLSHLHGKLGGCLCGQGGTAWCPEQGICEVLALAGDPYGYPVGMLAPDLCCGLLVPWFVVCRDGCAGGNGPARPGVGHGCLSAEPAAVWLGLDGGGA